MSECHWFVTPKNPDEFLERKKLIQLPLDRISEMIAPMITSSVILYPGQLNIDQFREALQLSIDYCPWLVGAISGNYGNASIIPRKVDAFTPQENIGKIPLQAGFFLLEYDDQSSREYDRSVPNISHLPKIVHEKVLRFDLAMQSIDGLPVASFRVTQYKNHFILTYFFSHIFFDRSSTMTYFKLLSKLYDIVAKPAKEETVKDALAALTPLQFQSKCELVPKEESYAGMNEFLAATPFGYACYPKVAMQFSAPKCISVYLCSEKVDEIKTENTKMSSNDLIHAFLLKVLAKHALTLNQSAESILRLFFARNMKPIFGTQSNVIGDYVRFECFPSSVEQVENNSLVELALQNRAHLQVADNDLKAAYVKECQWFAEFQKFVPGVLPTADYVTDPNSIMVTNWSTFSYDELKFGEENESPLELLPIEIPVSTQVGGLVFVTFRRKNGKRQLMINITTTHDTLLHALTATLKETEVFSLNSE